MAVTLQFVDSIASSPTVRLDLNDGTTWRCVADGTEFPPPPLRRAVTQTFLAHGASISASAYDNRSIKLKLALLGSSADTGATEMQKLARELNRTSNLLKWQPNTTAPVFFRTFRSDISSVYEIGRWEGKRLLEVELVAEPFAYGLKVTPSAPTVTNDPAAGGNAMFFDLAAADVTGDVETPLHVYTADTDLTASTCVLAVRRHGTPANNTWFRQAEALTLGADTTLPGNDAAASGSGSNYARTSFSGTTSNAERIGGVFPASSGSSVEFTGLYRVFARLRHSVSGDTITVEMRYGNGFSAGTVTLANTTAFRLVDLGILPMPAGNTGARDGYGSTLATLSANVDFYAARSSGSGNLDWDYILLVPADEELCLTTWPTHTGRFVWDGPNDSTHLLDSNGDLYSVASGAAAPTRKGSVPLVAPNQINRVFFSPELNSTVAKTATVALTIAFWPRYLYVRPATT